jgi:hypothetical protein
MRSPRWSVLSSWLCWLSSRLSRLSRFNVLQADEQGTTIGPMPILYSTLRHSAYYGYHRFFAVPSHAIGSSPPLSPGLCGRQSLAHGSLTLGRVCASTGSRSASSRSFPHQFHIGLCFSTDPQRHHSYTPRPLDMAEGAHKAYTPTVR